MKIIENIDKFLTEGSNVKEYVNKFKMKMGKASLQGIASWVDGTGLKPAEKAKVMQGILAIPGASSTDIGQHYSKQEKWVIRDYKWAKNVDFMD
jgi:hypothetical protein